MALPQHQLVSEEDYLAAEDASDLRHEYANGQVIAMTGASWAHNLICVNTSTTLNVQLADKDCRVTSNDLRLQVVSRHSYRYPDVMVICGDPEFMPGRTDTIRNPSVILEVLSDSTALIDRNEKLDEYMLITSVQEYVLISQHEAKIARYLRQDTGDWLYTQVTGRASQMDLSSICCVLKLADVYKKVALDEQDAG